MSESDTPAMPVEDEFPAEVDRATTPASSSLRERIAARRRNLQGKRTLLLPIPGFQEELWVRFKPVPWEILEKIANKTEKSKSRRKLLHAQADTLVAACDEVLVMPQNGETEADLKRIQDLDPEFSDNEPNIRFDQELAKYLVIDDARIDSARDVLYAVIPDGMALAVFHNEVADWQQSADVDVDNELPGK